MAKFEIETFPCRSDNFGVLIHDPESGATASIDAPEEKPVLDALERNGWTLTHILTTHHHGDHVEGNEGLKSKFGVTIIGPKDEARKIPGIDRTVGDGDRFDFAGETVEVIGTPGHTGGHISYFFPKTLAAFVGDTLFALGCGRLIEGDASTMWASLKKLMALPGPTSVYFGHEYTLANARFALTVDPDNQDLQRRAAEVDQLRSKGRWTIPTTIEAELRTNPFLRAADPSIRAHLGMEDAADEEVFAEIRRRKDRF